MPSLKSTAFRCVYVQVTSATMVVSSMLRAAKHVVATADGRELSAGDCHHPQDLQAVCAAQKH